MDTVLKHTLKVGWIGTGAMGLPMAGHLIRNGYKVLVNNRMP